MGRKGKSKARSTCLGRVFRPYPPQPLGRDAELTPGRPIMDGLRPWRLLPQAVWLPAQTGGQNPLQQRAVPEARGFGRVREIFVLGDLRVGVCFEHVDLAVRAEAQIDA